MIKNGWLFALPLSQLLKQSLDVTKLTSNFIPLLAFSRRLLVFLKEVT